MQAYGYAVTILPNATDTTSHPLLSKLKQMRSNRQNKVRLPEQSTTELNLRCKGCEESLLFLVVHLQNSIRSHHHESLSEVLRLHVLDVSDVSRWSSGWRAVICLWHSFRHKVVFVNQGVWHSRPVDQLL